MSSKLFRTRPIPQDVARALLSTIEQSGGVLTEILCLLETLAESAEPRDAEILGALPARLAEITDSIRGLVARIETDRTDLDHPPLVEAEEQLVIDGDAHTVLAVTDGWVVLNPPGPAPPRVEPIERVAAQIAAGHWRAP